MLPNVRMAWLNEASSSGWKKTVSLLCTFLNEMMDLKEKYEKIQKQIIFILRSKNL